MGNGPADGSGYPLHAADTSGYPLWRSRGPMEGSESSEIVMEFRCGAVGVPRITPVVSPQIVDLLHSTHVLFCKSSTLLELSQFLI